MPGEKRETDEDVEAMARELEAKGVRLQRIYDVWGIVQAYRERKRGMPASVVMNPQALDAYQAGCLDRALFNSGGGRDSVTLL